MIFAKYYFGSLQCFNGLMQLDILSQKSTMVLQITQACKLAKSKSISYVYVHQLIE